jgi:LmbE family N-acetylglucosaminyl deacetylase
MPDSRKGRLIVFGALILAVGFWNRLAAQGAHNTETHTVLAVFAHPDDEFMVSPILSRLAREGHRVHLAIASDGRYGVAEHAGIPAGDSLAAVRAKEIRCSANELAIEPPSLFGLKDGFAHKEPQLGTLLADFNKIHQEVHNLITELQPDIIITWSPGGGYGHPDHRAVSNIVTEVLQKGDIPEQSTLFYTGLSTQKFESLPDFSQPVIQWFASSWHTTDAELLTTRVPYSNMDLQNAREALGCHQSQFTGKDMDELILMLDYLYDGELTLRPWNGNMTKVTNWMRP